MKGSNCRHRNFLTEHFPNPIFHFARGFIRESHRQNLVWRDSVFNQIRDAMGERSSFPRSRSGDYEQRSSHSFDRLDLRWIQTR
jgi:hypothetical protein